MRHHYIDAMTLVERFGKLDIFLTMTRNSSWFEIKEKLQSYEEVHNRHGLIAQGFREKPEEKQIFRPIVAYIMLLNLKREDFHMLISCLS